MHCNFIFVLWNISLSHICWINYNYIHSICQNEYLDTVVVDNNKWLQRQCCAFMEYLFGIVCILYRWNVCMYASVWEILADVFVQRQEMQEARLVIICSNKDFAF